MAGHHGLFTLVHEIPKARVGKMGYIHQNAKALRTAHKVFSLRTQPTLRLLQMGTGQSIGPVPGEINEPHAPLRRRLKTGRITFQQICSFNRQYGRTFSRALCLFQICRRAAGRHQRRIPFHLHKKFFRLPTALGEHPVHRRPGRIVKNGKHLRVALKLPAPLQICVSRAAAQIPPQM